MKRTLIVANWNMQRSLIRQTYGFSHRAGFEMNSNTGCSFPSDQVQRGLSL